MRRPYAPFLELNFYFAHGLDSENFARFVLALHGLGATFTGLAGVNRGPGVARQAFGWPTDELVEEVSLQGPEDLRVYLADPDVRLVQVYMEGASGTAPGVAEVVTYVGVSPQAVGRDRHPLAIWTEGMLFSGPFQREQSARAFETGGQIYSRFLALIEAVWPDYGAITSEYSLEGLADLRLDPHSYAFRDFYVSGELVGPSDLTSIERLFAGAYVEPVGAGIYVSTMKEFNPAGIECDIDWALERSNEVAAILAAVQQI